MQPEQGTMSQILADPILEAQRLISEAQRQNITVRLLGGVAIRLRSPRAGREPLAREYADLDLVAPKRQSKPLREFLEASGYVPDRRFNALHGARRLLLLDPIHNRQIDIFLGIFEMCHKILLEDRLTLHSLTLSPADLLLTKLQVFELNRKDALDALALLLDYPPVAGAHSPGDTLDLSRITQLTSHDWGWHTSLHDNLDRVADIGNEVLPPDDARAIRERIAAIKAAMDRAPKSLAWRGRGKIGRRMAWYELPEEVRR